MMRNTDLTSFDREMGAEDMLVPPPDFNGPVKRRRVTDPVCWMFILMSWGFFAWIGVWSLRHGNPNALLRPRDYKGRLCGVDKGMDGVVLPSYWHPVDVLGNGLCVNSCPDRNILNVTRRSQLVCKDDEELLDMDGCTDYFGHIVEDDPDQLIMCGGCFFQMKSTEQSSYCHSKSYQDALSTIDLTAELSGVAPRGHHNFGHSAPYVERFVKDLMIARTIVIGVGIGGSVLLSFLLLGFLCLEVTMPAAFWMSVVLIPCCFGCGGYLFFMLSHFYEGDLLEAHIQRKATNMKIFAFISWIVTGLVVVFFVVVRNRLKYAVDLCKAAAQPVKANVITLAYPFVQLLGYGSFLYFWVLILIYLVSSGVPVQVSEEMYGYDIIYTTTVHSQYTISAFWYMLVVFFWTSEFVIAQGQITLAILYSVWYFKPNRYGGERIQLVSILGKTLSKHAGTAAVGGMVTKFVQITRSITLPVQQIIKKSGLNNWLTDVLVCCCQFCFFGLERCMKFVSADAYVHTAIFGQSYCKGAHEAFYLSVRNADRAVPVAEARGLLEGIPKLFVVSAICTLSLFCMQILYWEELSSIATVTVAVAAVSWYISDIFISVITTSATTLMQCFLCSEEMFGNEGPYSVPSALCDVLSRSKEEATDLNESKKQGDELQDEEAQLHTAPAGEMFVEIVETE